MASWYGSSFEVPFNTGSSAGTLTMQWYVSGDIGSNLVLKAQVKISGTHTESGHGTNVYYPNMRLYVSVDGEAYVSSTTPGRNSLYLDSTKPWQSCYMPNTNTYYRFKNCTDTSGNYSSNTSVWHDWEYNVGKARIVRVYAGNTTGTNADYRGILFMGRPTNSFYQIDTSTRAVRVNNIRVYNGSGWAFAIPYVYNGGWKNAYAYVHNGTDWKECRN